MLLHSTVCFLKSDIPAIRMIREGLLSHILQPPLDDHSLMMGNAGIALFLASNNNIHNKYDQRIYKLIDCIKDNVETYKGFGIANGVTGFFFLLEYCKKKKIFRDEDAELWHELYDIVISGLQTYIADKKYDYLHGYLGILNTLVIASPDWLKNNHSQITDVCEYLFTFLNADNPIYLNDSSLIGTDGLLNLGLAHGVPSMLCTLINIDKVTPSPILKEYITKLTSFIVSKRRTVDGLVSKYPGVLKKENEDAEPLESRFAWCYGDLGVNMALLKSARYMGNKLQEQSALEDLLESTKRRSYETTSIVDSCFCHGFAGAAYIYWELYNVYGLQAFDDTYKFWRKQIEDIYNTHGINALSFVRLRKYSILEKGLLEGLCGIYISLFPQEVDRDIINYLFLIDI